MATKNSKGKNPTRAARPMATKKSGPQRKVAAPKVAAKKTTSRPLKISPQRMSWLDAEARTPVIDLYAQQLDSFIAAVADGKVDEHEVQGQEARLVQLMQEIEPQLDDAMHAKITQLLCELTAYDIMQILHTMQQARPQATFQG